MASTFTTNLKFNKPALGDAGWGTAVNGGFTDLADVAISGVETVDVTAGNVTMTIDSGASGTNDARNMFIEVDGTLPANRVVTVPTSSKLYFVFNNTTGAYTLDFENAGGGVEVPQGKRVPLYSDGTEVRYAFDHLGALTLGTALAAASGGTGYSSYAVGDLLYADTTTTLAKLASVAEGSVLRAKGVGTAPAWEQVDLTTDVTGVLPVANGGTGVATLSQNQVLLGNGTSPPQGIAAGADGNVLTASSGTWVSAALSLGLNATVYTSGSGNFTIPTGVTKLKVTVVGGGGGSGGSVGGNTGGGGGGGGTAIKWLTGMTPGNTLAYSVGAGGIAGTTAPGNGGAGDPSTVSSGTQVITTLTGGGGGAGLAGGGGGAGGIAANGDLNVPGGSLGGYGVGGDSLFAPTSPHGSLGSALYGGGASSAPSGFGPGAAGAAGVVIFEW